MLVIIATENFMPETKVKTKAICSKAKPKDMLGCPQDTLKAKAVDKQRIQPLCGDLDFLRMHSAIRQPDLAWANGLAIYSETWRLFLEPASGDFFSLAAVIFDSSDISWPAFDLFNHRSPSQSPGRVIFSGC